MSPEPGEPSHAPTGAADDRSPAATTPRGSDNLPSNGAPSIDDPLDISHFLRAPCDVITDAEKEALIGTEGTASPDLDTPVGPECVWSTGDSKRGRFAVIFPQVDARGLTSLYESRHRNALFEQLRPVDGYPVVAYGITDVRHEGKCTLRVGVSDRETIDITLYLGESKIGQLDPCQAARDQVATAMIRNIKARQ
ncbi:uncharacterized protein DUF3558 [Prauserella muralis]|nr:uncharacterized protein DUF3558 [Prauserella muralis]